MSNGMSFDGRVVVVTGAGAGLGKAYAMLFASRGASVVVNDLGGGRNGDGSDFRVADSVVKEIRQLGGKAVANFDSVTNGSGIIKTAIDTYGRIDIVVNNAGILRDRSFLRMTEADWDIIQDVHVKGAMKTTQAAWPYFRKQAYGRIIFTSSNSGLYGNFGQANYSSAKSALVGLAKTLAIEGKNYNIHTNVIVPTAGSRLTEDIVPPDFFKELKPELIAPVVAWLCHEDCDENGAVIESALGWAAKYRLIRSEGYNFRQDLKTPVTPESVRSNWQKVIDMSSTNYCESIGEATGELLNVLENMKSDGSAKTPKHIMEHKYNYRDAILYAIGVGATKEESSDFRYLYENDENFSVLPTFYVIYGPMGCMSTSILQNAIPGSSTDLTRILHGEQYLKVHKALPTEATVKTYFKIQDVLDKDKSAVILIEHETFDKNTGEKLVSGQMSVIFRGAGGFKGPRNSPHEIPIASKPIGKPDTTCMEKTSCDQAVVYRLSGDSNPLHIDPNIAQMGGFKKPILHGLCSLGFSTRHVLKTYAGGNPQLFDAIKVRFAKPVIPGETLQTNMWQNGLRITFETIAMERKVTVITGAYIDLKKVVTQSLQPNKCFMKEHLESDTIFTGITESVRKNPSLARQHGGIFLYDVTSGGELKRRWTPFTIPKRFMHYGGFKGVNETVMRCESRTSAREIAASFEATAFQDGGDFEDENAVDLNGGEIYEGVPSGIIPDATIRVDDRVIIQVVLGLLNLQKPFLQTDVDVAGDIMLLQKLKLLTDSCRPKL